MILIRTCLRRRLILSLLFDLSFISIGLQSFPAESVQEHIESCEKPVGHPIFASGKHIERDSSSLLRLQGF